MTIPIAAVKNNGQPVMQTDNLSLYYGGKPAVESVSMKVMGKAVTTIVGPSGCGKTSFLISLNRLSDMIPGCRVSGSITLGGVELLSRHTSLLELRRRVGKIFQKPNPFPLSIRKNVEFPLREHGVKGKENLSNILETVLRDVGLWNEVKDRLNAPALALSGGQQQRLCIARALAIQPEVLLMDEPCSSLDPISSGIIEDLILTLKENYTILVVTHNLAQARRIADYSALFWLQNGSGRLIEYGDAKPFFEDPVEPLTAAYLKGLRG